MYENNLMLGDIVNIGDKSSYISGIIENENNILSLLLNDSDSIIEINDKIVTIFYPITGVATNLNHCRELYCGEFNFLASNMILYTDDLPILKYRKLKSLSTSRTFFVIYRGPEILTFIHSTTIPISYLSYIRIKRDGLTKSAIYVSSEIESKIKKEIY